MNSYHQLLLQIWLHFAPSIRVGDIIRRVPGSIQCLQETYNILLEEEIIDKDGLVLDRIYEEVTV